MWICLINERITTGVMHNHPEGIKGAEAAASTIYLARNGKSKDEIKEYIVQEFGYFHTGNQSISFSAQQAISFADR